MAPILTRENVLTTLDPQPSGAWAGRLRVDERNTFFFDHTLDHIPGMLLFEGLLRAAEHVAVAGHGSPPGFRLSSARLRMTKMCEKDQPVDVEILAPAPVHGGVQHCEVVVRQGDATPCAGTLSLTPATDGEHGCSPPGGGRPIDPALVHKRDREAVLIGAFHVDPPGYRAEVLPPTNDDDLAVHPDTLLLEMCRQFATSSMHVFEGLPFDGLLLLTTIDVDMRAPVPPGRPIHLWSGYRPRGGRKYSFSAEIRTDTETLGVVTMAANGLPKKVYAQLRDSGRI
ncbi:AfsA-related hotdog domain-containing protein [Sphaerisporangium sp. TRM90804]|uniref:AfsA-related hotdog domain-containing protein n=1 Tax=Sphaerisporangium sp. TRM90804 TaxID=3031113 RepID=UPI0024483FF4|nr:AfsA-related hotdog domain-containing protein [Sphaerisporangium sp. TRM90804]MDH2430337.1 AfsA-related hotdog domain-containing protein [Sphaerisporangium sp. TRM90804]